MWTEFGSGLIGALIGGAISIVFNLLARRDTDERAMEEVLDVVGTRADELRETVMKKGGGTEMPSSVIDSVSRFNTATAGLLRRLRKKDRVLTQWLMVNAQVASNPGFTNETRVMALSQIPPRMADWRTGVLSTEWFSNDLAETRESLRNAPSFSRDPDEHETASQTAE